MSDYFGALLRSAGALAAPARLPTPAPSAVPGDDIVEQDLEAEGAAPGERAPARAEPAHEQAAEAAAWPAAAPEADAPAPRDGVARQQPAAPSAAPDAPPAAPPPAPLPQREDPALAHPLVRAALRWVAADPQALPAPAHPAPPTHAVAPRAAPSPEVGPAVASPRSIESPAEASRVAAAPGRPQAVREIGETGEIELSLPAAPRRHAASEGASTRAAAAAPARPIELHIGTIHVAVDAPPPRAVVQPLAPPAPRPQAPAAERSGLSRLRLPRL